MRAARLVWPPGRLARAERALPAARARPHRARRPEVLGSSFALRIRCRRARDGVEYGCRDTQLGRAADGAATVPARRRTPADLRAGLRGGRARPGAGGRTRPAPPRRTLPD